MAGNCLDDSGYKTGEGIRTAAVKQGAIIRQIAAAAIAIDNAVRLIQNYKDQRDIAQRSLAISKAQQNQIATVFWPREEDFLAEFSTPEPLELIETMGRRYGGRIAAGLSKQFAEALKEARCGMRRYCASANRKVLQDLMMARSLAIANARVLGRNIAFAEYQARNDQNYNRRLQAVSLGRGLIQEAMSLYAAAGAGLASVGSELSANLNSALQSFGYARSAYSAATAQANQPQALGDRSLYTGLSNQNYNNLRTENTFGFQSSQTSMQNLAASNVMTSVLNVNHESSRFAGETGKDIEQLNRGDVGNDDLVRTGIYTFPVESLFGGTCTVDMDKFPLMFADNYTSGDYTTP